jgi:hypothetical protein
MNAEILRKLTSGLVGCMAGKGILTENAVLVVGDEPIAAGLCEVLQLGGERHQHEKS